MNTVMIAMAVMEVIVTCMASVAITTTDFLSMDFKCCRVVTYA